LSCYFHTEGKIASPSSSNSRSTRDISPGRKKGRVRAKSPSGLAQILAAGIPRSHPASNTSKNEGDGKKTRQDRTVSSPARQDLVHVSMGRPRIKGHRSRSRRFHSRGLSQLRELSQELDLPKMLRTKSPPTQDLTHVNISRPRKKTPPTKQRRRRKKSRGFESSPDVGELLKGFVRSPVSSPRSQTKQRAFRPVRRSRKQTLELKARFFRMADTIEKIIQNISLTDSKPGNDVHGRKHNLAEEIGNKEEKEIMESLVLKISEELQSSALEEQNIGKLAVVADVASPQFDKALGEMFGNKEDDIKSSEVDTAKSDGEMQKPEEAPLQQVEKEIGVRKDAENEEMHEPKKAPPPRPQRLNPEPTSTEQVKEPIPPPLPPIREEKVLVSPTRTLSVTVGNLRSSTSLESISANLNQPGKQPQRSPNSPSSRFSKEHAIVNTRKDLEEEAFLSQLKALKEDLQEKKKASWKDEMLPSGSAPPALPPRPKGYKVSLPALPPRSNSPKLSSPKKPTLPSTRRLSGNNPPSFRSPIASDLRLRSTSSPASSPDGSRMIRLRANSNTVIPSRRAEGSLSASSVTSNGPIVRPPPLPRASYPSVLVDKMPSSLPRQLSSDSNSNLRRDQQSDISENDDEPSKRLLTPQRRSSLKKLFGKGAAIVAGLGKAIQKNKFFRSKAAENNLDFTPSPERGFRSSNSDLRSGSNISEARSSTDHTPAKLSPGAKTKRIKEASQESKGSSMDSENESRPTPPKLPNRSGSAPCPETSGHRLQEIRNKCMSVKERKRPPPKPIPRMWSRNRLGGANHRNRKINVSRDVSNLILRQAKEIVQAKELLGNINHTVNEEDDGDDEDEKADLDTSDPTLGVMTASDAQLRSISFSADSKDGVAKCDLSFERKLGRSYRLTVMTGDVFKKHGRSGKPHNKFVVVADNKIYWVDRRKRISSRTNSYLRLVDIKEILIGKKTKVFQRATATKSEDTLCFSLLTKGRTLDLEAASRATLEIWIRSILYMQDYIARGNGEVT